MDYQLAIAVAAGSIVGLIVGFLADVLRKKVRVWLDDRQELVWMLREAAELAVKAAEQMLTGAKTGQQKFAVATQFVIAALTERGVKINPLIRTLIQAAIEAAVLELKKPG